MLNILSLLLIAAGIAPLALAAQANRAPKRVVFVCEHGSVKSLMAASLFNRLAAEQGLDFVAVSRGMVPDQAVPPAIGKSLLADGYDVRNVTPQRFVIAGLRGASRVVAIGTDVAAVTKNDRALVEEWNTIPAASEDYAKARDALDAHVRR